ncbi:sulfate adenylyltransferase [candidate division KSB1 bacterium]|nr:sulfate adenylyltransferase [candidate division KSB1 bacterium]
MVDLIQPHGGLLNPLLTAKEHLEEKLQWAASLAQLSVSTREFSDLVMLGLGAFSPLTGFMDEADYNRVLKDMHLANGILWPVPITLAIDEKKAQELKIGATVALTSSETPQPVALLTIANIYRADKEREALQVYRTTDPNHPGVAKLYAQPDYYLAGAVQVLHTRPFSDLFAEDMASPIETRALFAERGWKRIAAFQTRNPIHRSHEYCTKIALEICDGLFLHPIVGRLKSDDIPAPIRMKCYHALLDNYFPHDRVVLRVYPMEMRYAGPREAVLHAIIRQNFGCTHLIVGRDHAGVGNYYGPFDAQAIFDEIDVAELAIRPLKIDWTFWCRKCESMASLKTCPHGTADRLLISGSKLREMLQQGIRPPKEFSRPEVLDILIDYYQHRGGDS